VEDFDYNICDCHYEGKKTNVMEERKVMRQKVCGKARD